MILQSKKRIRNILIRRMNGIKTLEKIRVSGCRAAVIMMTGGDDPHNMEQAKELGILCYMVKPFDLFGLRERVKDILVG